jgi:hypothetical protein
MRAPWSTLSLPNTLSLQLVFAACLLLTTAVRGQFLSGSQAVTVRAGGGVAVADHDRDFNANVGPLTVEPYGFSIEGSVPLQVVRLGAGYSNGSYSNIHTLGRSDILHAVRLFAGFHLRSNQRISPYITAGPSLILGGSAPGYGASGSAGIDVSLTDSYAVHLQGEGSLVTPDHAVDGKSGGRSSLDLLGILSLGLTTTFY